MDFRGYKTTWEERMHNYTVAANGCWEWQGQRTVAGYGVLSWHGDKQYAHRLWWSRINGAIPGEMVVCHKCDNPPCVNPRHLFLGTQKDNATDASTKGRLSGRNVLRGEKHNLAKLTVLDVGMIRALLADGLVGRQIALAFNVAETNVSMIRHGRTWTGKSLEVD